MRTDQVIGENRRLCTLVPPNPTLGSLVWSERFQKSDIGLGFRVSAHSCSWHTSATTHEWAEAG